MKKIFRFLLTAVILCCSIVFSNCEEWLIEFDEKTFLKNWAAWDSLEISDYSVNIKSESYNGTIRCFFRTTVKNNAFLEAEFFDDPKYPNHALPRTISDIYNWIRDSYEWASTSSTTLYYNQNWSIKITYNRDFH